MSQPELKLVWVNEALLAASNNKDKQKRTPGQATTEDNSKVSKSWTWLRTNAPAIMLILAVITIVWHIAGTYNRLGNLEEGINGKEGVKDQLKTLNTNWTGANERTTKLEARMEVLFTQYLESLKPKAKEILTAPKVNVSYVTPKSNIKIADPDWHFPVHIRPRVARGSFLVFAYTIEGIIGNSLILRFQADEVKDGKIVRSVHDQRVQIKLPTATGERVTYDFVVDVTAQAPGTKETKFSTPPVRLELAVLERVGPTDLILASGLAATPKS
jgi:hypothetical protein